MFIKILRLSVTNCYILEADKGFVLIDTGYDWEWERFRRSLRKAEVDINKISHLILTHHHDDHAGLIDKLLSENPTLKVVMSSHARDLVSTGKNDRTHGGAYLNSRVNFLLSLKKAFDKKWTHTFPAYLARKEDIIVSDGLRLRDVGITLDGTVIETPGHSSDSITIALDSGDCFVGDAAAEFLQFAGTKHCIIYLEDLAQYYKSWERIIQAGAKQIFPGHGNQFSVEELRRDLGRNRSEDLVVLE